MKLKLIIILIIYLSIGIKAGFSQTKLDVMIDHPIQSEKRYQLMKEYAQAHYGMDHANLINPQMVVIHYSAIATLRQTLSAFESDTISKTRDRLASYGDVNVGTHYVVDQDGTIYSLLPTTLMARHVIGFNHTAIAIENVAADQGKLTDDQIRSNALIIDMLLKKHPSIRYVIGHLEYMNQTMPHFKLFREDIEDYEPSIKIDPGFAFMRRLRTHLRVEYNIKL
ncbi:N-acetylmuramoyl-L-alanine amidase [bacterium]|nr:N-acetylmuramoyl-L-alanine amidase [Actinomycetota bacterium]MBE32794.1 N-acetylmuramoyl-L-alanine amidase [bacterium]|tara:strand:- start:1910 stop:2581 length:672 start_codon:yes stop_codon:yes gene_type:complete